MKLYIIFTSIYYNIVALWSQANFMKFPKPNSPLTRKTFVLSDSFIRKVYKKDMTKLVQEYGYTQYLFRHLGVFIIRSMSLCLYSYILFIFNTFIYVNSDPAARTTWSWRYRNWTSTGASICILLNFLFLLKWRFSTTSLFFIIPVTFWIIFTSVSS